MTSFCVRVSVLAAFVLTALCQTQSALADVRLPGFFTDHMVLQQQMKIKVWGWAEVGEKIEVTIGSSRGATQATTDGTWQIELPAMNGSHEPQTLTVKGSNTVTLNDVLIGEVWLCSGQSNMEWAVRSSTNAAKEIAEANYPSIRHIKIDRKPNTIPQEDLKSQWQVCSPDTAAAFTACGYFMARKLLKELDVPIGLINSSWGGTRVEPWTAPVGFQKVEALQDIYTSVQNRTPGSDLNNALVTGHIQATETWLAEAKTSLKNSTAVPPGPRFPAELTPFKSHQDPTMLYNGMIHALVGYPMRGAIWYQGESNHVDGMLYYEKKKALINGWRELWGQGDFPFYYVQIAPYHYGKEDPTILARFWEAQAAVQQLPNTGMVVINDIATVNNIHPPNKQDVGLRLANLALKNDYGKSEVVANSPEFESLDVQDGRIVVKFRNAGGGLKTRDGKAPSHFTIIGPGSGGFQPATATIDGDTVILESADVQTPSAFRFAWDKLAEPNLSGGTGLPVGATRGGDIPKFVDMLPIGKDYKLVYDLDLSKLGRTIRYDVNNSKSVGGFNRVAYLLELTPTNGEPQKVFAAMDSFSDDVSKIGIPTAASKASFQQKAQNLVVYSTAADLTSESPLATGNIEFWPNNYGPANDAGVPGADVGKYDFGDSPAKPVEGYGSMQVHNFGTKKTIFAINHWGMGSTADIGIGNSPGETRDWTFTGNAGRYSEKRLRVYVKED